MAKYKLAPFKGKKMKKSRHPIMLNIYHGRDVKRYSTGVACTIGEWNIDTERLNSSFKGYKSKKVSLPPATSRALSNTVLYP